MSFNRWRIWCNVDQRWEEVTSTTAPTVCPTNVGHSVNINSVSKLYKIQNHDKVMMGDSGTGKLILHKNNYHFVAMTAVLVDDFWKLDTDLWATATDGAGSSININPTMGGVLTINAGNISGNSAFFTSKNQIASASNAPIFEVRGQLTANNEQTLEIGMSDGPTKSVEFFYDPGAQVGNIIAKCIDGGNVTNVDTGIIGDTNWHKYSIDVIEGAAQFTYDGNIVGNITSSIPSGPLCLHHNVTCKNGGQRSFNIDFVKFSTDRPGYVEGSGRRGGFSKPEKM